jgi:hypothetical protein
VLSNYYIVKIDIGSKQKYIFSSNRLKEIIGASEIIRFITEDLGKEVLKNMGKKHKYFTKLDPHGNVVFEAGGNAMYIFEDEKDAIDFNKSFSTFVMRNFDGLELLIVMKEFNIKTDRIDHLYDDMEELLTRKKGTRKNQFKRVGYGISKICGSTRKPAGYCIKDLSEDKEYEVSKESRDKRDFYDFIYEKKGKGFREYTTNGKSIETIHKEDEELLRDCNGFDFSIETDVLGGEEGEGSYIGIVCVDGNGMGKKIASFKEVYRERFKKDCTKINIEYIGKFRQLTKDIADNYKNAFKHMVEKLCKNYDCYSKEIGMKKEVIEKHILPIRPLILAGDDITFIANGKIAIEAAKEFIVKAEQKEILFGDKPYHLTTSTGIAIVKKNFPFARAVNLATQLEKNSKKKLKEIKNGLKDIDYEEDYEVSIMDWQVSRGQDTDLTNMRNSNQTDQVSIDKSGMDLDLMTEDIQTAKPYIVRREGIFFNKTVKGIEKNELLDKLKEIIPYDYDHFIKMIHEITCSGSKTHLQNYFRSMNSSREDAILFATKYDLQRKLDTNLDIQILSKVTMDAIDIINIYQGIEGGK